MTSSATVTLRKLDERESARTTGLAIDRHGDVGGLCDGREVGAEIRFARAVREVPDEQTDCQGLLVKYPAGRGGARFYRKSGLDYGRDGVGHRFQVFAFKECGNLGGAYRPSGIDARPTRDAAMPMTSGAVRPAHAARERRCRLPTYSASRRGRHG